MTNRISIPLTTFKSQVKVIRMLCLPFTALPSAHQQRHTPQIKEQAFLLTKVRPDLFYNNKTSPFKIASASAAGQFQRLRGLTILKHLLLSKILC